MSINALAAGFASALTTDTASGSFYDDLGGRIYEVVIPDQITALPACRWFIVTNPPDDTLANTHIDATVQVDLYGSSEGGSAELAGIADKLFTLLHHQPIVIAGYNGGQAICTDRGTVRLEEDGVFSSTSQWRIVATVN